MQCFCFFHIVFCLLFCFYRQRWLTPSCIFSPFDRMHFLAGMIGNQCQILCFRMNTVIRATAQRYVEFPWQIGKLRVTNNMLVQHLNQWISIHLFLRTQTWYWTAHNVTDIVHSSLRSCKTHLFEQGEIFGMLSIFKWRNCTCWRVVMSITPLP